MATRSRGGRWAVALTGKPFWYALSSFCHQGGAEGLEGLEYTRGSSGVGNPLLQASCECRDGFDVKDAEDLGPPAHRGPRDLGKDLTGANRDTQGRITRWGSSGWLTGCAGYY